MDLLEFMDRQVRDYQRRIQVQEWATSVARDWTTTKHGDRRTLTPPTRLEMLSGAVCSTMQDCQEATILDFDLKRTPNGNASITGRCPCGQTFAIVASFD